MELDLDSESIGRDKLDVLYVSPNLIDRYSGIFVFVKINQLWVGFGVKYQELLVGKDFKTIFGNVKIYRLPINKHILDNVILSIENMRPDIMSETYLHGQIKLWFTKLGHLTDSKYLFFDTAYILNDPVRRENTKVAYRYKDETLTIDCGSLAERTAVTIIGSCQDEELTDEVNLVPYARILIPTKDFAKKFVEQLQSYSSLITSQYERVDCYIDETNKRLCIDGQIYFYDTTHARTTHIVISKSALQISQREIDKEFKLLTSSIFRRAFGESPDRIILTKEYLDDRSSLMKLATYKKTVRSKESVKDGFIGVYRDQVGGTYLVDTLDSICRYYERMDWDILDETMRHNLNSITEIKKISDQGFFISRFQEYIVDDPIILPLFQLMMEVELYEAYGEPVNGYREEEEEGVMILTDEGWVEF